MCVFNTHMCSFDTEIQSSQILIYKDIYISTVYSDRLRYNLNVHPKKNG